MAWWEKETHLQKQHWLNTKAESWAVSRFSAADAPTLLSSQLPLGWPVELHTYQLVFLSLWDISILFLINWQKQQFLSKPTRPSFKMKISLIFFIFIAINATKIPLRITCSYTFAQMYRKHRKYPLIIYQNQLKYTMTGFHLLQFLIIAEQS